VRWVFLIYALPLFVSLALAAFEPVWGAAIFIAMSVIVVLSSVDTGRQMLMRGASGNSTALLINQWTSTAALIMAQFDATAAMVAEPETPTATSEEVRASRRQQLRPNPSFRGSLRRWLRLRSRG